MPYVMLFLTPYPTLLHCIPCRILCYFLRRKVHMAWCRSTTEKHKSAFRHPGSRLYCATSACTSASATVYGATRSAGLLNFVTTADLCIPMWSEVGLLYGDFKKKQRQVQLQL